MRPLSPGDLIRDNLGRKGIVAEKARKPNSSWIRAQNDKRVRTARGPWWNVFPLGGGGVLVPESLARRLRRATVDDIAALLDSDGDDRGAAVLRHLFKHIRAGGAGRTRGK